MTKPQIPPGGDAIRPEIDVHRARQLKLAERPLPRAAGAPAAMATFNDGESPLAWLARRKGRDGRPMIEPHHLMAGERLRADFSRAQLMPRTTSNWSNPLPGGGRSAGGGAESFSDAGIAARQRVRHALDATGPEFSGLLVDVCCFLKGLEDVESERGWPARSAKIVLQLALERLARHYGWSAQAHGKPSRQPRAWLADDVAFSVDPA